MNPPVELLTKEGFDLQFGTNVLGHWYFTELLMPALLAASSAEAKSRVITVSSNGAYMARNISHATLTDGEARRRMSHFLLYPQSKLVSTFHWHTLQLIYYNNRGMYSLHVNSPVDMATRSYPSHSTQVVSTLSSTATRRALSNGLWYVFLCICSPSAANERPSFFSEEDTTSPH
jgi:hypothetical protein